MPKVKPKRKNPSIDMTAMVDVAFLLLTFFIMSAKFKASDKVLVDTPTSISTSELKDKNLFIITVDKSGMVVVGVSHETQKGMLEKMIETYSLPVSEEGMTFFANQPSFGVPLAEFGNWLGTKDLDKIKEYPYHGIPVNTERGQVNELKEWINAARRTNYELRFAIKGDRDVAFEKMDKVIATLQEVNINRFNLITGLEADPNAPQKKAAEAESAEAPAEK